MISPQLKEILRSSLFINRIVWASITISIGAYVVVAWTSAQQPGTSSAVSETLQLSMFLAAIAIGFLSLLIPRYLPSDKHIRSFFLEDVAPEDLARNPQLDVVDPDRLRMIQALDPIERKLVRLPSLYFTPFILRLVLNEAIVIFGLVLSFISHTFPPILPFAVAALTLNIIAFPKIDRFAERASRFVY